MSKAKVDEYARDCRPMDDDWPWAEFIAPKLMYERNVDDLLRELRPYAESPIPFMRFPGLDETSAQAVTKAMDRRHRARLLDLDGVIQYYSVSVPLAAEDAFKKALAIDANDCTAKYYLKELALARTALFVHWGEMKDAIDYLAETVKSLPDEPLLFLRLGDIYFDSNQLDKAAQAYKVYLSLGGTEARARSRVQAFETASGSPSG
jgi:tetratricopeptide (TPR) repeat protein